MTKSIHLLTSVALLCAMVNAAEQSLNGSESWPRFRGPNGDGVAADNPRLPETWNTTNNVKWVVEVPGWGWSSPIVWGERVFLTSVVSQEENEKPRPGLYLGEGVKEPAKGIHHWLVHCFDFRSGKLLWKREPHTGRPEVPRHPKNTYAAETAATDGRRVYALFGDLGLFCFDMGGKPLWSKQFAPKKTLSNFGAAASPVVHDDQVFVVYDNQEDSFIVSFDAATGSERWRVKRHETSTWATPFVWQNEHRTEIVVCGRRKNRAYDLAGKVLWEFDGRMSSLVIPSPFASEGLLYITSGYVGDPHRPVFAVKPGASGDISLKNEATSNEFIAWYQARGGPYNPSPIVYRGRYYTLYDHGFLTCHDARSGREIYGKTRFPERCSFTASPVACNGKLFCLSEDGDTYVIDAGSEFKVTGTNALDELCLASPAISNGNLLIRTASKLYCIGQRR